MLRSIYILLLLPAMLIGCATISPNAPDEESAKQFQEELRQLRYQPKEDVFLALSQHGFKEPESVETDGNREIYTFFKSYLSDSQYQIYDRDERFYDRLILVFESDELTETEFQWRR